MTYETYWSILDAPTNSIKPYTICLIAALLSLTLQILFLKFNKITDKIEKNIVKISLITIFFISIISFIYLKFFYIDNSEKRINTFLESQYVDKIEGIISEYKSDVIFVRNGKQTSESFMVEKLKFQYLDNSIFQFGHFGGNRSDFFRNGLKVRITYRKSNFEILKIEIPKGNLKK